MTNLKSDGMTENSSKIKNKISIVKPQFSLTIETDESLDRAREIFEDLMEKHRR